MVFRLFSGVRGESIRGGALKLSQPGLSASKSMIGSRPFITGKKMLTSFCPYVDNFWRIGLIARKE